IYLYALTLARPDLLATDGVPNEVSGEVVYRGKSVRIPLTDVTHARRDDIVAMVRSIADTRPPAKSPSRYECQRCNIARADCPERFDEDREPLTAAAAEF